MPRLPLHDLHARLGARWEEQEGWEIPCAYSGWKEEYAAIQGSAGLSDLSFLSKIFFIGPDRRRFLNGLLTNDVAGLKPLAGLPACLLTPKGKLRADLLLYDLGSELLALARPSAAANLARDLSRIILLSQTTMEDSSRGFCLFYLAGPKALLVEKSVFGRLEAPRPYEVRAGEWQGSRVWLLSEPRLRPEGCLVLCPVKAGQALWQALTEGGRPLGLKPAGSQAFNALRLERGLPLFGVDMDQDTIPLEAGLEEAISFTKGCYLGQETIARVKNLGHINRILAGLRVSGEAPPAPGTRVFHAEKEIGRVTKIA